MTFSVAKLCPIKHWQAKCHKRRRQQVFDVLSMLCWKLNFLHLSSYHIKTIKIFYEKKIHALCLLILGKKMIKFCNTEDKNNFLMFWACFVENWNFFSYLATIIKKLLRFFLKKQIHALCHLLLGKKMIKCCNTEDKNNFWCSGHAFLKTNFSIRIQLPF